MDIIFPVGTGFTAYDDTDYSNRFGFTWEKTCIGRVPVGKDNNQEEFKTIGKEGGSKYLQEHWHDIRHGGFAGAGVAVSVTGSGVDTLNIPSWAWDKNVANSKGSGSNLATNIEGSGKSQNLQPYQVVNFWKRLS